LAARSLSGFCGRAETYNVGVAAKTSFQIPGLKRTDQAKLEEAVRLGIGDRPGRWRVQFLGHMDEEVWEMCVSGPALETSEFLDRSLGQDQPDFVAAALDRIAGG
jgi:hypothetical protein